MWELFVEERDLENEIGQAYRIQYYILVEEAEAAGSVCCESYGIRIVVSGSGETQSESLRNVTLRAAIIDKLVHKMADHLVTPTTLRDIVEDWMAVG